ncbi:MAG: hypothetical protein U5J96_16420 [Ignavibacteriaceae bacterium]|nr:hypothetical protein [Ignavibacteriaceae bacterium]
MHKTDQVPECASLAEVPALRTSSQTLVSMNARKKAIFVLPCTMLIVLKVPTETSTTVQEK